MWCPEVNAVFQGSFTSYSIGWIYNFLLSGLDASVDATKQCVLGLFFLCVHADCQLLFNLWSTKTPNNFFTHAVAMLGFPLHTFVLRAFCSYTDDFTFVSADPHLVGLGPMVNPAKIMLKSNSVFLGVSSPGQLCAAWNFGKHPPPTHHPGHL